MTLGVLQSAKEASSSLNMQESNIPAHLVYAFKINDDYRQIHVDINKQQITACMIHVFQRPFMVSYRITPVHVSLYEAITLAKSCAGMNFGWV